MDERKIKDSWYIIGGKSITRCIMCKHFTGDRIKRDKAICKAFENGIPKEYYSRDENDERECSKGLKYEYEPYSHPRFYEPVG